MADEELQEYKLKELREAKENHEARIKILEESKIETKLEFGQIKTEFANLKQSQIEQKALILEIDRSSREKNDRLFSKIFDSQDIILNKIIENKSSESKGNIEITKTKLAIYGSIITAIITIVTLVVEKVWN